MATSPEPKGIHKIPNEILVKILTIVPYVPEVDGSVDCSSNVIEGQTTVRQTPAGAGSHVLLRQVNKRFRDIVNSPALRLETVRHQYSELAALRHVTSIGSAELVELALLDTKVQQAATKVIGQKEGEKARQAVIVSLHFLGYMAFIVGDERGSVTNAYLLAWAKRDFFTKK